MKTFFSGGGEKPKATELPKTVCFRVFVISFSLLSIGQNMELTRRPWPEEFLGLNHLNGDSC